MRQQKTMKMGINVEHILHTKIYLCNQFSWEKMLNILVIEKMQIKTTTETLLLTLKFESLTVLSIEKDMEAMKSQTVLVSM